MNKSKEYRYNRDMDNLESKLQDRVAVRKEKQRLVTRTAQKRKYTYAKGLGFKSSECTVLQNWSMDKINQLAKDRGFLKE